MGAGACNRGSALEIAAEVRDLHEQGIAGVEIGQGAFPNNEQLVALFKAANQAGIKISLSHGPTQNPAGYSIDDDHARKTLVVGKAAVTAGETFDGHLPPPTLTAAGRSGFGGLPQAGRGPGAGGAGRGAGAAPGGRGGPGGRGAAPQASRATLIAVLAYRCTMTPCPATGPAELDRSSVIDLTPGVTGKNTAGVLGGTSTGDLRWTAPPSPGRSCNGELIAFWSEGAYSRSGPVQRSRLYAAHQQHGVWLERGGQGVAEGERRGRFLRLALQRSRKSRRTLDQQNGRGVPRPPPIPADPESAGALPGIFQLQRWQRAARAE